MSQLAQMIKQEGVFQTYLGGPEEAVYWYNKDVWVVRVDSGGKLVSIWNPTNDVLIRS